MMTAFESFGNLPACVVATFSFLDDLENCGRARVENH
jgi:hypothetical protein